MLIRERKSILDLKDYCTFSRTNVSFRELLPYRFFKGSAFGASLNKEEKRELSSAFTGLKVTGGDIKKLAPTATVLYYEPNKLSENQTKILSKFYRVDLAKESPQYMGERLVKVCEKDMPSLHLDYNCIGYALDLVEWASPHKLAVQKNNKKTIVRAINSLVEKSQTSITSHEDKKLEIYTPKQYKKLGGAKHDDVALFFNGEKLVHAAKYGANNKEKTIECWNSKFGSAHVFCHDLDNVPDSYGDVCYYLRWTAGITNTFDHKIDL